MVDLRETIRQRIQLLARFRRQQQRIGEPASSGSRSPTARNSELVDLLARRLPKLSDDEIRASLVRARATFDFPVSFTGGGSGIGRQPHRPSWLRASLEAPRPRKNLTPPPNSPPDSPLSSTCAPVRSPRSARKPAESNFPT